VPEGLVFAGAVVGLVGGLIGAAAGGIVVARDIRAAGRMAQMRREAARLNYGGMTVNERLAIAGVMDAWDSAIEAGDRQGAIEILSPLGLSALTATVDGTLANPEKYGFRRPPAQS